MEANEGRWDLSALYNGFDDPAFEADIARLDGMMEAYRQQVRSLDGLDAAALADLLGREEAMWVVGADLQKFTNMRREADAGDSQAVSAMGRLKKLFGSVAGEAALVRRWMGGLVLTEADYAAHPILADYRFFIGEGRKRAGTCWIPPPRSSWAGCRVARAAPGPTCGATLPPSPTRP